MTTFSDQVRESMLFTSAGYCQCSEECIKHVSDFDHIIPNTKPNNKLFPLFLHSPFNCLPINRGCHDNKGKKSTTLKQAHVYEKWLQELKGSRSLNM